MLSDNTPFTTIPTADLGRARAFYEGTLGLQAGGEMPEGSGVLYKCGSGGFMVYSSQFAGTNQATAMGFQVDDAQFDAEVAALRGAGVTFDTFELEGATWEDGVALGFGGKSVWFRDPDGNILNVTSIQA